jgi:pimeloyl-ACP methyl ester carboxylesterase
VSYALPGLVLVDHEVSVPLDHARRDGERITVFAREVAEPDGRDKPFLVYLEGGPGFQAPRPTGYPRSPGWLDRALRDFRVLMLDQRGTGRSTPVGTTLPGTPAEQAEYLAHFRADAIVRDCEAVREALGSPPWTVLGQSFGGMTTTTYLSLAPEGLREALICGGVPNLGRPADDVYRVTYELMIERSERYYARFPEDRERVRRLVAALDAEDVRDAAGDRITSRRLRTLGNKLGMSDGWEELHYVLELPVDSPAFRHDAGQTMGFARNPIYAILHEAGWADGSVSNWSAERMRPAVYDERVELFTGEHVFPWAFSDIGALRPLREAADLLAAREWPRLYDEAVLAANEVPAAAAIYTADPYVPRVFSEETVPRVRGLRAWVTSEYDHNGLRADGDRVLSRLLDLVRGRA